MYSDKSGQIAEPSITVVEASAFLASADPWPPSLLFFPFKFLSLSLFFSLSRLY
jgi:hypothetical protein